MTACRFWPEISPKTPPGKSPCSTPMEFRSVRPLSTSRSTRNSRNGGREIVPTGAQLGKHSLQHHLERGIRSGNTPPRHRPRQLSGQPHLQRIHGQPGSRFRPRSGLLLLSNLGGSRYHEFEATLRVRPSDKADFNISYVNSQARGDLNTMASVYVPYEQPVIQPNLFGTLPTNVPDRVVTWGRFKLPQTFIVSPVLDWHSGFPFSIFDDLQNYVGPPNSRRFPAFLSLDSQVSKDFRIFSFPGAQTHLRGSVRVFNLTNHGNFRDVSNTVTRRLRHLRGLRAPLLRLVSGCSVLGAPATVTRSSSPVASLARQADVRAGPQCASSTASSQSSSSARPRRPWRHPHRVNLSRDTRHRSRFASSE